LTETGGHHFDYARLVAEKATGMGIDPVVGANRGLRPDAEKALEETARVCKSFRETTYTPFSHLAGLKELAGGDAKKLLRPDPDKGRIHNFLGRRARKKRIRERGRRIRQFAEDCETFFQPFSFDDSDHVFFTTISELEFMGLAAYLGNHPRSIQVTWHVQFHFGMFSGRPDEFQSQGREERLLQNAFQSALARVPYHALHAYTTSDELASQYNRMKLMSFDPLPYPVNPRLFLPSQESSNVGNVTPSGLESSIKRPLKLAIAGGVRREKGQKDQVHELINNIWEDQLATSNVQLNIQTGTPGLFACNRVMRNSNASHKQYREAVRLHSHPLPENDYIDFIHNSDVGLFCYDSRRYYSRRAGILSEFLASGKPVIVPAGSWLAQQIAEPAYNHVEQLIQRASRRQSIDITEMKWGNGNVPLAGGILSFDQSRNTFLCRFDASDLKLPRSRTMAIGFRWQWPRETGSFVQIELTCFDEHHKPVSVERQTVTSLPGEPRSLISFRMLEGFHHSELRFRNAYIDSSISIADVRATFLDHSGQPEPARSAVGIIVADPAMLPQAVDEMVKHYEHYQRSAVQFSRFWARDHDPARTLEALIPMSEQIRCAA